MVHALAEAHLPKAGVPPNLWQAAVRHQGHECSSNKMQKLKIKTKSTHNASLTVAQAACIHVGPTQN